MMDSVEQRVNQRAKEYVGIVCVRFLLPSRANQHSEPVGRQLQSQRAPGDGYSGVAGQGLKELCTVANAVYLFAHGKCHPRRLILAVERHDRGRATRGDASE